MKKVAAIVLVVAAACGGPESMELDQGAEALKAKSAPVRPEIAPNVTVGPELKAKPRPIMSPMFAWSVTIAASDSQPWATRYTVLTATANADVWPTPYYIRIVDTDPGGGVIASCGSGTSCSFPVSRATVGYRHFKALIQDFSGGDTPASTPVLEVYWHGAGYGVMAVLPQTTVAPGASVQLISGSTWDVGPSPDYTELWDDTDGTLRGWCGSGTRCTGSASQGAPATHVFHAYLMPLSFSYPPIGAVEMSPPCFVTWSNRGYTLSLDQGLDWDGYPVYVATANVNVGLTPYYIQLFDADSGAPLGDPCGYGTECRVRAYLPGHHLVAFITYLSSTITLSSIQASSNVLLATYRID